MKVGERRWAAWSVGSSEVGLAVERGREGAVVERAVRCVATAVRSHPTHAVLGLVWRQLATQDLRRYVRLQQHARIPTVVRLATTSVSLMMLTVPCRPMSRMRSFIARFCRTSARLYRATKSQTLRLSSCTLRLWRINKNTASAPLFRFTILLQQEAQLSPSDRVMRLVSSNLANYHATVQKLLRPYTTSPDQTDGMKLEV